MSDMHLIGHTSCEIVKIERCGFRKTAPYVAYGLPQPPLCPRILDHNLAKESLLASCGQLRSTGARRREGLCRSGQPRELRLLKIDHRRRYCAANGRLFGFWRCHRILSSNYCGESYRINIKLNQGNRKEIGMINIVVVSHGKLCSA